MNTSPPTTLPHRPCAACGAPIKHHNFGIRAHYCGRDCWPDTQEQHLHNMQHRYETTSRKERGNICEWCHHNPPSPRSTFCSYNCNTAANSTSLPAKECIACSRTFTPNSPQRLYCNEACRQRKSNWRNNDRHGDPHTPIAYRQCPECGEQFIAAAYTRKKFCTDKCSKKTHRRKRRSIQKQGVIIGIWELGERDNWTCHLCHEPVPRREYRGTPQCPTIDHLTPVSKGGAHTWDNVALAHMGCNSSRQAKALSDPRLSSPTWIERPDPAPNARTVDTTTTNANARGVAGATTRLGQ